MPEDRQAYLAGAGERDGATPKSAHIYPLATPDRLRHAGASLGYQLASVTSGGLALLIATWLFGISIPPPRLRVHIALCAINTVAATAAVTNRIAENISGEY